MAKACMTQLRRNMLDLLTAEEVAEMLRVKKKTVYDWVRLRRIPYCRVGRLVRFKPADLEKWAGTVRPTPGVVLA